MFQKLRKEDCCKKCKGCIRNGIHHESGAEWTEPNDPCTVFTCIAGVITESPIVCHTPCPYPTPPAPGQCCPTCPNCRVKEQRVVGEMRILPEEDPCVTCQCSSGSLACVKKACPVLNCPGEKVVQSADECCPKCLGTGKYIEPPNGACILNAKLYHTERQFTTDDCTKCVCQNTTIHCEKKTCPILRCKREHQEITSGQCCPECKRMVDDAGDGTENESIDKIEDTDEYDDEDEDEKYDLDDGKDCTHANRTYKIGEVWNTTTCQSCICKEGNVECSATMCPATKCPTNSVLKIPDGQCCPICVESEAVCTVFGGAHFRTFDGRLYAFVGSCKYQLADDCDGETFGIRLKIAATGNDASLKRVSLKLGNLKVDLQQNRNAKVNDRVVGLPYRRKSRLEILEINRNVVVRSKLGIIVHWNYMDFLEVTVPRTYRKKLCGLCGNLNASPDDDLTTREGIPVEDPATFAQSWTAGDEVCLETRNYGIRGCNPRRDQRLCNYVKGAAFEKCLKKINVTSYYKACLNDMCDCAPDDRQCHCASFASYVRDCRRLGILLPRWRKSVGC